MTVMIYLVASVYINKTAEQSYLIFSAFAGVLVNLSIKKAALFIKNPTV